MADKLNFRCAADEHGVCVSDLVLNQNSPVGMLCVDPCRDVNTHHDRIQLVTLYRPHSLSFSL